MGIMNSVRSRAGLGSLAKADSSAAAAMSTSLRMRTLLLNPDRRRPRHLIVRLNHADVIIAFARRKRLVVGKRETHLALHRRESVDELVIADHIDLPHGHGADHLYR